MTFVPATIGRSSHIERSNTRASPFGQRDYRILPISPFGKAKETKPTTKKNQPIAKHDIYSKLGPKPDHDTARYGNHAQDNNTGNGVTRPRGTGTTSHRGHTYSAFLAELARRGGGGGGGGDAARPGG